MVRGDRYRIAGSGKEFPTLAAALAALSSDSTGLAKRASTPFLAGVKSSR